MPHVCASVCMCLCECGVGSLPGPLTFALQAILHVAGRPSYRKGAQLKVNRRSRERERERERESTCTHKTYTRALTLKTSLQNLDSSVRHRPFLSVLVVVLCYPTITADQLCLVRDDDGAACPVAWTASVVSAHP